MWAPVYQSTHVYIRWQLWELILYFYHVNLQNWTKDSCLVASPFTSWAISLAQMSYTDGETEALKRNNLQCVTNYEVWLDEEQEFWASRSNMSQEAQVGLSPVLSQHSIPGTSLQSLSSPHTAHAYLGTFTYAGFSAWMTSYSFHQKIPHSTHLPRFRRILWVSSTLHSILTLQDYYHTMI